MVGIEPNKPVPTDVFPTVINGTFVNNLERTRLLIFTPLIIIFELHYFLIKLTLRMLLFLMFTVKSEHSKSIFSSLLLAKQGTETKLGAIVLYSPNELDSLLFLKIESLKKAGSNSITTGKLTTISWGISSISNGIMYLTVILR